MKRTIFAILSMLSLAIMTACGAAPEPSDTTLSPSETTVTSTTTEKERETVRKTRTIKETETVSETRTETETQRDTVEKTRVETETNTVTATNPEPHTPDVKPVASSLCQEFDWWSTLEDSTDTYMVEAPIYDVRIGRHECFDRIVIDVDTTENVGFHAKYVSEVYQSGSGFPVPVDGGAVLELVVDAPLDISMYDNPPEAFTKTPNWTTLREVKSAGSFEGITKFAIGAESKVKFGVFHHTDEHGHKHVVVDLIHSSTPSNPEPQPPPLAPSVCEETYGWWSTLDDSTEINMVRGEIYDVRIGRHECFDRVVIDVDTTEDVGFHARYVDVGRQFGSGLPVPVDGGAVLELVVDAPVRLSLYDNPPAGVTKTPNWETLREVNNAGHFEGITKFIIGVDSKVKYGVFHHTGDDGRKHVVVDLVHPFS